MHPWFAAALLFVGAAAARAETLTPVTIGVVRSLPAASVYLAIEEGYFRAAGIDVHVEFIDSAAKAIALLAADHMQVIEGGVSVGYFNAVAQGLPMRMALEAGSSPVYQKIVLRPDLTGVIKTVADLKGRSLAEVAPGSVVIYQTGKVLETAGLTLKDIDIKYIPFPAMGVALSNKAVDAAFIVSPFSELAIEKGFAAEWLDADTIVRPTPLQLLAFTVNTDWAAKNPGQARGLFLALARGGREYCQAYHHGPNRDQVIDLITKYDPTTNRALLERIPWQARNPSGRFNVASVLDMENWFFTAHLIDRKPSEDQLFDMRYADEAERALGPFTIVNQTDTLKACR